MKEGETFGDVPFDPRKPAGWHDDYCTECYARNLPLLNCAAADCYAAFCEKHAHADGESAVFICPACAAGARGFSNKYEEAHRTQTKTAHKESANVLFWSETARACGRDADRVDALVLDHAGGTVAAAACVLPDHVRRRLHVVVPNPDGACRRAVKRAAKKTGVRVRTSPLRLGAFLTSERDRRRFRAAWADYCGVYDGCAVSAHFPRHDLRKLFEYGLDADAPAGAVMAVTLCTRNSRTPVEDAVREMVATAELAGRTATVVRTKCYGSMVLIIMRVRGAPGRDARPRAMDLLRRVRAPWLTTEAAAALAAGAEDAWASADAMPSPIVGGGAAVGTVVMRGGEETLVVADVRGFPRWVIVAYKEPEPCGAHALELVQL